MGKKLILILAAATLSVALFAQTENMNTVTGLIPPRLHTSDAEIILDVTECNGKIHYNDDADVMGFKLPAAQAGLVACFHDLGPGVITVDVFDGVDVIVLNGVSGGAGNAMASAGDLGDCITLIAVDDTRWVAQPFATNTWGIP